MAKVNHLNGIPNGNNTCIPNGDNACIPNGDNACIPNGGNAWIAPDTPPKCTYRLGASQESSPHQHRNSKVFTEERKSILPNVLKMIGDTPLVRVNNISKSAGLKCELLAKLEYFNAGGSVKDRIGLRMIEDAERDGRIKPGDTLIEPTSGNTGTGLALAAAVKGYRCVIVMAQRMSYEKECVLRALGAEVVRTPTMAKIDGPDSHISVAQRLSREIPNSVLLYQYRNASNPLAHYDTTAEELLKQCDGQIDMIVIGVGTGGTISGIGRKLKENNPNCKVIAVAPENSVLTKIIHGENPELDPMVLRDVEGLMYDFVPSVLDKSVIDQWYKCTSKDSLNMARRLIREEGFLCGSSCGAAMDAAVHAAQSLKEGQRCVVILPDSVRSYMTTFLSDDWMISRGYMDKEYNGYNPEKHWWWNQTVACLNLRVPLTILPTASIQDCMDNMNWGGVEQLPVVSKKGLVLGLVSVGDLMPRLHSGKVTKSTPVSEVPYTQCKMVSLDTTLGELSHILKLERKVLVVNNRNKQKLDSVNKITDKEQNIFGIVTRLDLLNYTTSDQQGNGENGIASTS